MRITIVIVAVFYTFTTPALAQDIFDYFENGTWGLPRNNEPSCANNPHTIRFSGDHKRVKFTWSLPVKGYLQEYATGIGYDVLSYDSDGITMAMDGEQRLTFEGKPVIWILKPIPDHMYCWGRTDWPSTGCIAIHIKCPDTDFSS